ncbi:hypothetical protein [Crateriforma spongiae]|uniref:hypothetical protein n=1 Tax=Crateriforma spongiae TaxID=2724528 RepID=UPI001445B033|nr:hypothetical protein [Crateriforma spongiae]
MLILCKVCKRKLRKIVDEHGHTVRIGSLGIGYRVGEYYHVDEDTLSYLRKIFVVQVFDIPEGPEALFVWVRDWSDCIPWKVMKDAIGPRIELMVGAIRRDLRSTMPEGADSKIESVDDALDVLRALAKSKAETVARRQGKSSTRGKGKTNQRLAEAIQKHPDRIHWTAKMWGEKFGVTDAAVKQTPCWTETIMAARKLYQADRR